MGYQPIDTLTKWWGLWRWDKIEVKVLNNHKAILLYEQEVVNSSKHMHVVKLGFFEKRKGLTLQDKAKQELVELIDIMKRRNESIIHKRELEREIEESVMKRGDHSDHVSSLRMG